MKKVVIAGLLALSRYCLHHRRPLRNQHIQRRQ